MDDVNKLLDEKYELLAEVLSLCNNVPYSKEVEENIIFFAELYDDRQVIFEKIYIIDEAIIDITKDKNSIQNDKIKAISKEIRDFDINYRKNEDEFMLYLSKKMKGISNTKRINDKFNHINYESISGFNVQG